MFYIGAGRNVITTLAMGSDGRSKVKKNPTVEANIKIKIKAGMLLNTSPVWPVKICECGEMKNSFSPIGPPRRSLLPGQW